MKLLIKCLIFLCLWCCVKASCRIRSECIEIDGRIKTCPYDGEALPINTDLDEDLEEELFTLMELRCPEFLYDENGNRKDNDDVVTCCDSTQFLRMGESILLADGILGRCPTCLRNFVRQICEMNCSPDQSRFVDIRTETADDGTVYVDEIDYRMYEEFMERAHASCSGVLVPQTGLPAINLMCGSAPVCDAESWFAFSGDIENNPLAPIQVNYLKWPTEEDSMNAYAPLCNETSEGDIPCSCVDCLTNCPIGNEPVLPDMCTVLSVNCTAFAVGLTFFIISITFFSILTILDYRKTRNTNSVPQDTKVKPENNKMISFFQRVFSKIGAFSANNSMLVFMLTSWVAFAMFFGVLEINLTANPIELWSAPDSRSRQELNYFNSRFGPFYRPAQIFMQMKGLEPFELNNVTYGPAFRVEALIEAIALEDAIINIGRSEGGVTIEQVCYAPLRTRESEPLLDHCVVMSATTYLGNDRDNINNATYLNRLLNCINNHYSFDCLSSWGGGAEPELAFGGFDSENIYSADTLVITFPIASYLLDEDMRPVLEWEAKFLELLHDYDANWKADFVDVSYNAERGTEDELERVSRAEVLPITMSYVLMFIYVTIALGNIRHCKTWLLDSKIFVAISSMIVVLIAIFCTMGVLGYAQVTVTLLVINVIPFFVLSVGIDNVFLMVNTLHDIECNLKEYEDYKETFSFDEKREYVFSKMLGRVGPSIFVSAITQITCFAIGNITDLPAVVTFALFASISLAFLFVFQITTVVAILSLDYKRVSQNRLDLLCCVQKKILDDSDPLNSGTPYVSVIKRLMEPYSKFITNWRVKIVVVVLFLAFTFASVLLIPELEIGLDQELSLPTDSYVYRYLVAVANLLRMGPPVYFVLKSGLNFTDFNHQNAICGGQLCHQDSLVTQIFLASQYSEITHIAKSSNSWLDDFTDWTSLYGACCRYNITDGSFCQSTNISPECMWCSIDRNENSSGLRPSAEAFQRYIPFFLQDAPTDQCNKGGLASYSSDVNYILDSEGRATIFDTNFMAYHVVLRTSADYINAVKYGYEISANISEAIQMHTGLDVEVFPYSLFYIYYEQYLTTWVDTFMALGFCLLSALVFNFLATGFNFLTTFAVIFTAVLVVVDMMGIMYLWSIPLNAISCINLIVSIGISVEFCSHIAYAFATSKCHPREKVADALKAVGSTIITGITFTNIPVIVLAFSYTQIIEVFFFRMFFSIVLLGFLHGMIFLPVLLSFLVNIRH